MNIFDIQNKQRELGNKLHEDFESCFAWNSSLEILDPVHQDTAEFLVGAFSDVDFLLCLAANKPFGSYNHFFSRNHTFVCGPDPSAPSADCCSYVKKSLACTSKEYPRCENVLDRVLLESYDCDTFWERESVGILAVLFGISVFLLCLTVLRRHAFSALLKKNLLLYKHGLIVNVIGQGFGIFLLGALIGLITNNTETVKSYVKVQDLVSDAIRPIKHKLADFDMKFLIETPDDHRFMLLEMFAVYGGLLFVVIFSHPLTVALSAVVHEKETRMKQVFKLTGVSEVKLTLSHNFAQLLFITPLCLLLSVMSQPTLASNHSLTQVFFFFLSYFLSMLSGFNIIAVFFTRQVHARMVAILIIYFIFLIYYVRIDNNEGQLLEKKGACIVSTMCFSLGMRAMVEDSIRGKGLSHSVYQYAFADSSITVDEATTYMLYTSLIYILISVYLDKIIPQEDGYYQRPDFFLVPLYKRIAYVYRWINYYRSKRRQEQIELTDVSGRMMGEDLSSSYFNLSMLEEDMGDLEEPESSESIVRKGVVAEKLRKVFKVMGLHNNERVAVNDVDLSLHPDEITVLLGPNGAGKTTLMHMLVGLLPCSSGSLTVFDRKIRVARNQGKIGWCPQFDILYPELTIRQHIELFLALRTSHKSMADFQPMLEELDLWGDVEKATSLCSLGQRRKLSLVLSLLGDTQFVVIDEVSSGVDPTSKVSIWNVLKQHVQDRVVLLSTHFMDEADVLGKKVVIMSSGKVICQGSPVELKNRFVPFYRMTLTLTSASLHDVHHILASHNPPVLPEQVEADALEPKSASGPAEIEVRIPTSQAQRLGDLIRALEHSGCAVKVESASLEDVLLSIPRDADPADEATNVADVHHRWRSPIAYLLRRSFLELIRDRKSLMLLFCVPLVFWVIPTIFAGVNAIALLDPSRSPPSHGADACQTYIDAHGWQHTSDCCDARALSSEKLSRCLLTRPQCVDEKMAGFDAECRRKWAACTKVPWFCDLDVCCNPGDFRSPYYVCQGEVRFTEGRFWRMGGSLVGPRLREAFWNARNKVRFNSYCSDFENVGLSGYIRAVVVAIHVALGWVLPMSLILAQVVREREVQTKFHLLLNGVSRKAFWAATFVFHVAITASLTALMMILLSAYYGPIAMQLGNAFALALLFCAAVIPFIYIVSLCFRQVDRALIFFFSFNVLIIGAWIFSFVIYILAYYEGRHLLLEAYHRRREIIRDLFSSLPPFALIDALFSMQEAVYVQCVENEQCTDIQVDFRKSTRYLLLTLALAPLLLAIAENYTQLHARLRRFLGHWPETIPSPSDSTSVHPLNNGEQLLRKENGTEIEAEEVRKKFGRKQVLCGVSVRISRGEIFGLLGRNGAGKTTLIRMVAGQLRPSAGQLKVGGVVMDGDLAPNVAGRMIGYCPQADALFEFLTVKEHLEMYASIKGVARVAEAVGECLRCLELGKYANVISKQLSGGNKRKLSVAIALIGDPAVLLLDEASTGMDPRSQKLVKSVLKGKSRESAILLASHQLSEVESMCSRVGILKNGQLERTGTCASIKEALYKSGGQILNLQIRAGNGFSCRAFLQALQQVFTKAKLEQSLSLGNVFTFKVHTKSLAKLFDWLARNADGRRHAVVDMSIAVTGLEDSFNRLVKDEEKESNQDADMKQISDGASAADPDRF